MEQSPGVTDIIGLKLNEDEARDLADTDRAYEQPERMAFVSFAGRIYDMVRLLGAYGQNVDGPQRQAVAGGVAVVSGNVSLIYAAARPYMDKPAAEQSVNLSLLSTYKGFMTVELHKLKNGFDARLNLPALAN